MAEEQEKKPLEVLVADDEPFVAILLKRSISSENVTVAVDGIDAIQKYDERLLAGTPYNVVLADLNMPWATGVDIVKHVKQKHPETLVYIITGVESNQKYEQLRNELNELKPDGVIQKPFSPQKIADLIKDIKLYLNSGTTTLPAYQNPI